VCYNPASIGEHRDFKFNSCKGITESGSERMVIVFGRIIAEKDWGGGMC
jgi:hypothetical protein